MTQSDDKPRGINAREASRLRATLGSEPSSGYAFHDAARVERVRSGRPNERTLGQVASHAPHEANFKQTLVGVTVQDAQAARAQPGENATANDQGHSGGTPSWPPMPHVPNELIGVVMPENPAPLAQVGTAQPLSASHPPNVSSAPPVGGAIWQALPSVVESSPTAEEAAADTVPVAAQETAPGRTAPARNAPANGWKGSMTELDAEAGAYGDARIPKYEALLARGAWEQLIDELGREPELSPALELLRIIARRETLKTEERQHAAQLSQDAIGLFARLLNLPEASPTALLLGKRLLRKNPGRAPAPSTGLSAGIVLAGIAIGAGIGWLVTRIIL